MTEAAFFQQLLWGFGVSALVNFPIAFFVNAPYGRFVTQNVPGPMLDNRWGWVIMEAPAAIVFALCFIFGERQTSLMAWLFFVLWEAHYVQRSFIYPFSLRGSKKQIPLLIVVASFIFNLINGYLNGRYLFTFAPNYSIEWLSDPRFILGVGLFTLGYVINRHSDYILTHLRAPGESGYKIPQGGLYRWVSAPNYLGEIVEWMGWALATWSLPGLVFAVWTISVLAPRARAIHHWYKARFTDYPPERRALLPFVF